MVLMNLLRMLVDCSFFCAFAGIIAVRYGGSGALWGVLFQCLGFGLSCLGRERRWLRLLLLLPICLGWIIYRASLADCILLIPTAIYLIRLVWKRDYALEHDRQRRLFHVFWKILLCFIPVAMLMGGMKLIPAVTVPYGIMGLVSSVLLLRALRHDAKVYSQRRYQLMNLTAVAAVVAAGGLLSTRTVRGAFVTALQAVCSAVIRPVLELVLNGFLWVIWGIIKLVELLGLGGANKAEEPENTALDLSGMENLFGNDYQLKEPGEFLRVLGWVLGIAAAVVVLVFFFRWLGRRGKTRVEYSGLSEERETVLNVHPREKQRETSPVRRIRTQYRRLLKYYASFGIERKANTTSLDIHRQVECISGQAELSGQIRDLYIRARYAGRASGEDAKRMKQLCSEAEKPRRET